MPKSERTILVEKIRRTLRPGDRYVSCAFRLVSHTPGPAGKATPFRSFTRVYGGLYDRVARRYVVDAGGRRVVPPVVHEVSCHEGQVRFLLLTRKGLKRVIGIGAMGAGKTMAGVIKALMLAVDHPNTCGGLVSPIGKQKDLVREKFLGLAGPLGLIENDEPSRSRITLVCGSAVDVMAAQKSRKDRGYPFQGRDWDWAVADESSSIEDGAHTEMMARGRTNADVYCIYECTTYDDYPAFVMRLERCKLHPDKYELIKYFAEHNPFIDRDAHADNLRTMPDREYRRKVLLEDVPPDRLVYPHFAVGRHVKPRPAQALDATEAVTHQLFGTGYKYVLGQDFGQLVSATIVLRCYRINGVLCWWAEDEITSWNEYSNKHARLIRSRGYGPEDCIVIADPHLNSPDSDKSDYNLFRNEGWTIMKAHHSKIAVRHRLNMVNSLLENANYSTTRCLPSCPRNCAGHGESRLFLDCDGEGRPHCERLARALLTFQKREDGTPQPVRKDANDQTHWPDALGYGLYPAEKILSEPVLLDGALVPRHQLDDPMVKKIMERQRLAARVAR